MHSFLERNSNFFSSPHFLWRICIRAIEVFRPSPVMKYPNYPLNTECLLLRTARILPRTRNLLLEKYSPWIAVLTVSNGLVCQVYNDLRITSEKKPRGFNTISVLVKHHIRTSLGLWRLRRKHVGPFSICIFAECLDIVPDETLQKLNCISFYF